MALDPSQDPTSIYYKGTPAPTTVAPNTNVQSSAPPLATQTGMQALQATGAKLAAQGQGYNSLYQGQVAQGATPQKATDIAGTLYGNNTTPIVGSQTPAAPTMTTQPGSVAGVGIQPKSTVPNAQISPMPNGGASNSTTPSPLQAAQTVQQQAGQAYAGALTEKGNQEADIIARQKDLLLQQQKVAGDQNLSQQQYITAQADIQRQTNNINAAAQIQTAGDASKAMSQNFAYLAGAIGQPISDVGHAGQTQQLQRANELVQRISALKNLQDKGYDTQIAKQMSDLQKDLDSNVSQSIQQQLNVAMKLNANGQLDTPQAIMKFKQDALKTVVDTYNNSTIKNVELAKYYLDNVTNSVNQQLAIDKVDPTITAELNKGQNNGFVYNSYGQKVNGADGTPMRVSNPTGNLLTPSPIELADGSKAFIYQNPDGTSRVEKIKDTGTILSESAIPVMAQQFAAGNIKLADIAKLPKEMQDGIFSQVSQYGQYDIKPEYGVNEYGQNVITGYTAINKNNVHDIQHIGANGQMPGSQNSQGTNQNSGAGIVTGKADAHGLYDMTGSLNRPSGSTNVGQDTNNPGNIMAETEGQKRIAASLGAVGTYNSPNGRTYAVFPDMETGKQATISDITTKLTGGSSWVNKNTTLAQLATGWTSGPNAPVNNTAVNNYVQLSGYPANTKISDIPKETLIHTITANEGVDFSKSAQVPQVGVTPETASPGGVADQFYQSLKSGQFTNLGGGSDATSTPSSGLSDAQMKQVDALKGNYYTKAAQATLTKAGITDDQLKDYVAQGPSVDQGTVQSIIDGRQKLTDATKGMGSGPMYEAYKNAVYAKDPTYNEARYDFIKGWTTGTAKNSDYSAIGSFNKSINHLTSMYDASKALANSNFDWENTAGNWMSAKTGNTSTQEALSKFNTEKQLALTEIGNLVKGGVLYEAESKSLLDNLNTSSTPSAVSGTMKGLMDLIAGRMDTLSTKYQNNMGKLPDDIFTQKAYENMQHLQQEGIVGIDPSILGSYKGKEASDSPTTTPAPTSSNTYNGFNFPQ